MSNIRIVVPDNVKEILNRLNHKGFEAFVVGGCVRDSILGRAPGDWDITTNALPDQIKSLFVKTVDTGLKHGTVTVLLHGESYEVTTYRVDGEYLDNRRPQSVEFTGSIRDDLSRRDFTMNAIAYHPDKGFVDPFDGLADIHARLIRAVGNAGRRFQEDALRMIRAVRFSAQLDFSILPDTAQAILENCELIRNISQERVRDELTKLLLSDHPMRLILLRDTHLLQYVLPEFEVCFHTVQNNPWHTYNVAVHTLHTVAAVEKQVHLRWTMLLHDIGKPLTRSTDEEGVDHFYGHPEKGAELSRMILKRLRLDNKTTDRILALIRYHDRDVHPSPRAVRKAVVQMGEEVFEDLLRVKRADKAGQAPEKLEESLKQIEAVELVYRCLKEQGQCIGMKDLAVNGDDLLDLGFRQGVRVKEVLNRLLEEVLEEPGRNRREVLLETAKEMMESEREQE